VTTEIGEKTGGTPAGMKGDQHPPKNQGGEVRLRKKIGHTGHEIRKANAPKKYKYENLTQKKALLKKRNKGMYWENSFLTKIRVKKGGLGKIIRDVANHEGKRRGGNQEENPKKLGGSKKKRRTKKGRGAPCPFVIGGGGLVLVNMKRKKREGTRGRGLGNIKD